MASNGRRGRRRAQCEAYKVFVKNVERSRAFIRIFGEGGRRQGTSTADERELLRGALVFSIGALDNFVHELIIEIVPQFGDRSAMKEPLRKMARDDPALALRVALAGSPEQARDEFRVALDTWLESRSFHGVAKVKDAMVLVNVTLDESKLPANWERDLESFTEQRHQVVHRGDKSPVTRDDASACTGLVESLGKVITGEAVKHYH